MPDTATTAPTHASTSHASDAFSIDGHAVSATEFFAVATHPQRHVVVQACAGAGKTHMLVARVLRILLEPESALSIANPAQILALTFTRKACAEMSERVTLLLRQLHDACAKTLPQLLQALGYSASEAHDSGLQQRAKTVYPRLLLAPQGPQFLTFDAWFCLCLQQAPMALLQQLGLPLQPQLQQDSLHLKEAVWARFEHALVRDQSTPDSLQRHYQHLVQLIGSATTQQLLEQVLLHHADFQLGDTANGWAHAICPWPEQFPELAQRWHIDRSATMDSAQALQDPLTPLWTCAQQQQLFEQVARHLARHPDKVKMTAAANQLEQGWSTRDFHILQHALLTEGKPRVLNLPDAAAAKQLAAAQQCLQMLLCVQQQHRAWAVQTLMLPLARLMHRCHAATRHAAAVMDFADVALALLKLMSEPQYASWLQPTLEPAVRHVLIDEFQDTSPLQWQILWHWFANFAGSATAGLRIFIVGDPKQSIYGFRGAQPRVFSLAQQFLQQGFGAAMLRTDHTRRCAPAVVQALNRTLGQACAQRDYPGFSPHTTAVLAPDGAVQALPQIPKKIKNAAAKAPASIDHAALPSWRPSLSQARDPAPEEQMLEREVAQMAAHIASLIASGVAPSSVMVLARKHEPLGRLRSALRQRHVASVLGEKTTLIDTLEVSDVMALLQALVNPGDSFALAHALKSPLIGLSDQDLMQLALAVQALPKQHPSPWWQALQQCQAALALQLQRWRELGVQLSGAAWLQHMAVQGQWLARYASCSSAAQWPASEARLLRLLALAYDVPAVLGRLNTDLLRDDLALTLHESPSNQQPVRRWLRQLLLCSEQVYDPGPAQALRLLTIHGAKGLQADIVYLLDTQPNTPKSDRCVLWRDWPAHAPVPQKMAFLESTANPPPSLQECMRAHKKRQALEDMNLLYVAMTRAKHRLILSSQERNSSSITWWQRVQPHSQPIIEGIAPDSDPGSDAAQDCVALAAVHRFLG